MTERDGVAKFIIYKQQLCCAYALLFSYQLVKQWFHTIKECATTFVTVVQNPNHRFEKQNIQYQGFARGHPPYYWPGSNHLNFRDRTGSGAL